MPRCGWGTARAVPGDAGVWSCFFFQAEDGIRDSSVTGVQTCALPISESRLIADLRVSQNSRQCNFSTQILPRFERDAHARLCSLAQGSPCVQIAVDRPKLSFATDAPGLATQLTGTGGVKICVSKIEALLQSGRKSLCLPKISNNLRRSGHGTP